MSYRIAILGTRGIPNHYGGYEQAVTWLAPGLVKRGHLVTVYNTSHHPYRNDEYEGVEIIHCGDPENYFGAASQFIYDWHCLRHAGKRNYDAILLMGYTSSSIWRRLYPRDTVIISNMDGLEWKRNKYTPPVKKFLRYAENLAVRYSDHHIADSPAISDYLQQKYQIQPAYIPYGASVSTCFNLEILNSYKLEPGRYFMLVARMEPENNIETILDGFALAQTPTPFLVIGNMDTAYGRKLRKKYCAQPKIRFLGTIYDQASLDTLRHYCQIYFHGHSVGGTNPSLLEAMACSAPIAAHDNPFNKAVTGQDALYFTDQKDIAAIIAHAYWNASMITNNLEKIRSNFNWDSIIDRYEQVIRECVIRGKK
jgi:glycosyltransferase involved in cell wall biosynthesis